MIWLSQHEVQVLTEEQFGEILGNLSGALHLNSACNSGLKKLPGILLIKDRLLIKDDSTQIPILNHSSAMQLQEVQENKPLSSRACC